jgi:hypothetical protein
MAKAGGTPSTIALAGSGGAVDSFGKRSAEVRIRKIGAIIMKIEIEIDGDTAMYINRFLDLQDKESQSNTHGPLLDVAALATLLLQDVALVLRRRGSWEGTKMADLLASHGYAVGRPRLLP